MVENPDKDKAGGSSPPRPTTGLTSANAGHRVRSSSARVGVGSRTLTWLPLLVMEPDGHNRGLSDAAISLQCMIRAFCRTPQGSPGRRSRSPRWHREAADRPRRTQPRLVCRARARRVDDRYPVGHQHVAEPPQEPMVLVWRRAAMRGQRRALGRPGWTVSRRFGRRHPGPGVRPLAMTRGPQDSGSAAR